MIFKREKEIVANIATAVTGYRVTPELLESRTRKKEVVNTRQVLMYIMWQNKITLSTIGAAFKNCLLYTSPSPRDGLLSRMPSSA